MAKLYFRHGTVGSAKTLNLLAVAHNYRQQGKKILLMKPNVDTRFGKERIKSRAGLEMEADILIANESSLKQEDYSGVSCILVDEVQFVTKEVIEELRRISLDFDIPVLCYGLRTDFKSYLFEGSKRLMELADSIEEVKATCHYCNRKSIMNLKHVNGLAASEGPSVELGAEEKYFPTCFKCYRREIEKAQIIRQQQTKGCETSGTDRGQRSQSKELHPLS
ncbi:MAG: Thymidine kinase [uncultured bacterium]|nr:MAG: Thymidine kinase [uncultured bacterium]OGN71216.1 MAG: thymidine kinase [Chlamydiae bacterium RIFCSPLOWO2_12_FULL_45_20]